MRGLNNEKRYALLDSLLGLLLLEMIVYHFFWDLVYLFEQDLPWFHSSLCYWWQQSICWRFIFLLVNKKGDEGMHAKYIGLSFVTGNPILKVESTGTVAGTAYTSANTKNIATIFAAAEAA